MAQMLSFFGWYVMNDMFIMFIMQKHNKSRKTFIPVDDILMARY